MRKIVIFFIALSIIFFCSAFKVSAEKIYFGDMGQHKIRRCDLDGSNIEVLVSTGLQAVGSITVDRTGGKMYWADWPAATARIQRADLDGSNVENLVIGLSGPYGIALDIPGGKMYWTEFSSQKIRRANLDGTGIQDLVTSGLSHPNGIALDLAAGKMYWCDGSVVGKIQRANLDGTNIENLVTSGLSSPMEIALDVSSGKMYWADLGTGKIQRADLSGSNVEDLVSSELGMVVGIDLDLTAGKIYFSDFGGGGSKLKRANLDGTVVEGVITSGIGACYGLSLGPAAPECSNASLVGPWLIIVSGVEPYDYAAYLIFDGLGAITEIGSFNVPYPAGTYSVAPDCSMSGTIWSDGYVPFTGNIYSDSTADMTGEWGTMPLLKVMDVSALQGCWAGSFVQDSTFTTYNVMIDIDASGSIQSATGFPAPVSGKMFFESDYLAGHINTGASPSPWEEIMLLDATVLGGSLMTGRFGLDCGNCKLGSFNLFKCTSYSGARDGIPRGSIVLEQNYPNPFNPSTRIAYSIPDDGHVNLQIIDASGRLVRTLINRNENSGKHEAFWDGRDNTGVNVSSGVYFLRLRFGRDVMTRKIVLLK